jgi:hypothetical protein
MKSSIILASGTIFVLGLLGGFAFWRGLPSSSNSMWKEIAWPFGRDAWPPGRAFRCIAPDCGEGAELYVRPKMGFCNCALGVSDDEEVDRVTDLDLISERFRPVAAGTPANAAGLAGRSRAYALAMPDGTVHKAAGIALSHRCDALVAAAHVHSANASGLERVALELLSSKPLTAWIDSALGRASAR